RSSGNISRKNLARNSRHDNATAGNIGPTDKSGQVANNTATNCSNGNKNKSGSSSSSSSSINNSEDVLTNLACMAFVTALGAAAATTTTTAFDHRLLVAGLIVPVGGLIYMAEQDKALLRSSWRQHQKHLSPPHSTSAARDPSSPASNTSDDLHIVRRTPSVPAAVELPARAVGEETDEQDNEQEEMPALLAGAVNRGSRAAVRPAGDAVVSRDPSHHRSQEREQQQQQSQNEQPSPAAAVAGTTAEQVIENRIRDGYAERIRQLNIDLKDSRAECAAARQREIQTQVEAQNETRRLAAQHQEQLREVNERRSAAVAAAAKVDGAAAALVAASAERVRAAEEKAEAACAARAEEHRVLSSPSGFGSQSVSASRKSLVPAAAVADTAAASKCERPPATQALSASEQGAVSGTDAILLGSGDCGVDGEGAVIGASEEEAKACRAEGKEAHADTGAPTEGEPVGALASGLSKTALDMRNVALKLRERTEKEKDFTAGKFKGPTRVAGEDDVLAHKHTTAAGDDKLENAASRKVDLENKDAPEMSFPQVGLLLGATNTSSSLQTGIETRRNAGIVMSTNNASSSSVDALDVCENSDGHGRSGGGEAGDDGGVAVAVDSEGVKQERRDEEVGDAGDPSVGLSEENVDGDFRSVGEKPRSAGASDQPTQQEQMQKEQQQEQRRASQESLLRFQLKDLEAANIELTLRYEELRVSSDEKCELLEVETTKLRSANDNLKESVALLETRCGLLRAKVEAERQNVKNLEIDRENLMRVTNQLRADLLAVSSPSPASTASSAAATDAPDGCVPLPDNALRETAPRDFPAVLKGDTAADGGPSGSDDQLSVAEHSPAVLEKDKGEHTEKGLPTPSPAAEGPSTAETPVSVPDNALRETTPRDPPVVLEGDTAEDGRAPGSDDPLSVAEHAPAVPGKDKEEHTEKGLPTPPPAAEAPSTAETPVPVPDNVLRETTPRDPPAVLEEDTAADGGGPGSDDQLSVAEDSSAVLEKDKGEHTEKTLPAAPPAADALSTAEAPVQLPDNVLRETAPRDPPAVLEGTIAADGRAPGSDDQLSVAEDSSAVLEKDSGEEPEESLSTPQAAVGALSTAEAPALVGLYRRPRSKSRLMGLLPPGSREGNAEQAAPIRPTLVAALSPDTSSESGGGVDDMFARAAEGVNLKGAELDGDGSGFSSACLGGSIPEEREAGRKSDESNREQAVSIGGGDGVSAGAGGVAGG
ncbi:unnamed protein product, partial [Sphacelaria rigidula]